MSIEDESEGAQISKLQEAEKTVDGGVKQDISQIMGNTRFQLLFDKDENYLPPTQEEEKKIQYNVSEIGRIFNGAQFEWLLDGALNISLHLHNGEKYIRNHKDVDVSVFEEDLESVMQFLKGKNYVVCVKVNENPEPVALDEISKRMTEFKQGGLQIYPTDEKGDIVEDGRLSAVDLHIQCKDEAGNIRIGYSGDIIPRDMYKSKRSYTTQEGYEIPISPPALVAYHKLTAGRDYDFKDIEYLLSELSDEDIGFYTKLLKEKADTDYQEKLASFDPLSQSLFSIKDQSKETIQNDLLQRAGFESITQLEETLAKSENIEQQTKISILKELVDQVPNFLNECESSEDVKKHLISRIDLEGIVYYQFNKFQELLNKRAKLFPS